MDQTTLVDGRIEQGRAFLDRLARNHFQVSAAFWDYDGEFDRWSLYIVTPEVDVNGIFESYRRAHSATDEINAERVDPVDLRLIGPNDPKAKAVLDFLAKHPGRIATRVRGARLGDVFFELAYLYPPSPVPH